MIQSKKRQLGAATLLTSTVMLILITMVVMLSANMGVMETKTTSNEYRALQASLSAQAGIDFALAILSQNDLTNPTAPLVSVNASKAAINKTAVTYNDGSTTQQTGSYTVSIDKVI